MAASSGWESVSAGKAEIASYRIDALVFGSVRLSLSLSTSTMNAILFHQM
jgi:hypothetical protein